jgi:hypothetical protein
VAVISYNPLPYPRYGVAQRKRTTAETMGVANHSGAFRGNGVLSLLIGSLTAGFGKVSQAQAFPPPPPLSLILGRQLYQCPIEANLVRTMPRFPTVLPKIRYSSSSQIYHTSKNPKDPRLRRSSILGWKCKHFDPIICGGKRYR